MMKKSVMNFFRFTFVTAAILAFTVAASSLPAKAADNQAGGAMKIGYVDYSAVISMHPDMRFYVPEYGIFYRPIDETADIRKVIDDRKKRFDANKTRLETVIIELQGKITETENEIGKLQDRKLGEMMKINANFYDLSAKKSGDDVATITAMHNENVKRLDAYFKTANESLISKREDMMKELKKKYDEMYAPHYLNEKESSEFFAGIIKEIDSVIDLVAQKEKVTFIMNSDFMQNLNSFIQNTPDETLFKITRNPQIITLMKKNPDYDNFAYLNDSDFTSDKNAAMVLNLRFKQMFSQRNASLDAVSRFNMNNKLVLKNGIDLTPEVLLNVFLKNGYSMEKTKAIIGAMLNASDQKPAYEKKEAAVEK